MKFERGKYILREGLDDLLKNNSDEEADRKKLWREAWDSKSRYKRMIGLTGLMRSILPERVKEINESLRQKLFPYPGYLPFSPEEYDFKSENIGNGGQSRIYILASRNEKPSWALKILRPDNKSLTYEEQIEELKSEYKKIKGIYKTIPDLIPPEYHLALNDPFEKDRPAAAILQPFINGRIKDLFSHFPEELEKIKEEDPYFKDQLIEFLRVTLEHENRTGEIIDFLGSENVVVVDNKEKGHRLVMIDPHVIYSTWEETNPKKLKRIKTKLGWLKEINY